MTAARPVDLCSVCLHVHAFQAAVCMECGRRACEHVIKIGNDDKGYLLCVCRPGNGCRK